MSFHKHVSSNNIELQYRSLLPVGCRRALPALETLSFHTFSMPCELYRLGLYMFYPSLLSWHLLEALLK